SAVLCLACMTAAPAALAAEPAPDPAQVLQAVARPAPSRTVFVEVRQSPMLRKPLRIEGEYRREADGSLVRQVTRPYAETTTLSAGEALIEREGRAPRRVSLQQVPELAAIQAGFGALLAGDTALLEKTYQVQAGGTRRDWPLRLPPPGARRAAAHADGGGRHRRGRGGGPAGAGRAVPRHYPVDEACARG